MLYYYYYYYVAAAHHHYIIIVRNHSKPDNPASDVCEGNEGGFEGAAKLMVIMVLTTSSTCICRGIYIGR